MTKRVLSLCAENVCRSQMAEALFNRLAKNGEAESAGTMPAQRVNPLAIKVMKEVGIDISKKRPKGIDFQTVGSFARVISFGCIVRSTFPAKDNLEEWPIEDPQGQDIARFGQVRDIVHGKVRELIQELEGKDGEHG